MTASVEAANPRFDEALTSLAHLGRKIDQSVRSTTLASLNTMGFRGMPPTQGGERLIEASVPADVANPEESNSTASTPRTAGSEATPGNPAYSSQTLAQAIADALKLVLWPKLESLVQQIQDCCNNIAQAVTQITTAVSSIEAIAQAIEACKCAALPSELMSSLTRIEKALAEAAKTDLGEALGIAASIAAVVGAIGTVVAIIVEAPVIAAIAALAGAVAGLAYLGHWTVSKFKDDHDVLNRAEPRTDTILDKMRMRTTEPLEHLPESRRRDREEMLLGALRYFENVIRQLQEIIDDPAAEHDIEASARRAKAEELLPSIMQKYRELRKLFFEKTLRYPPIPENLRDDLQDPEERDFPGEEDVPSPVNPNIPSYSLDRVSYNSMQSFEGLEQMLRPLIDRLKEPVRLEVRLLDDRVIARRLTEIEPSVLTCPGGTAWLATFRCSFEYRPLADPAGLHYHGASYSAASAHENKRVDRPLVACGLRGVRHLSGEISGTRRVAGPALDGHSWRSDDLAALLLLAASGGTTEQGVCRTGMAVRTLRRRCRRRARADGGADRSIGRVEPNIAPAHV